MPLRRERRSALLDNYILYVQENENFFSREWISAKKKLVKIHGIGTQSKKTFIKQ